MNTVSPETLYVDQVQVVCDGSEGALGHPRIYLRIDERGYVDCGYCDRHFILTAGPADHRHAQHSG